MFCIDVKTLIRDHFLAYPGAACIDRDKANWISEYSDDIFKTLKDAEVKAKTVYFRSRQCECYRPQLLDLLRLAAEKHNLRRTTFHLACYLLDRFMDAYTFRMDKLNLVVITCLLLAAKIEEADMNLPKFSDLCELVPEVYTLQDYRKLEVKLLNTINFELIRPTAATFAEYFLNGFITLDDYRQYTLSSQCNQLYNYNETSCYCCPGETPWLDSTPPLLPWYTSYDDMVTQLSTTMMSLIDVSLNYYKFANARPSIIASACIAAVRQMQSIRPVWTPYLIQLTGYTVDVITSYVDALILLSKMYSTTTAQLHQPLHCTLLCDSPDSGIVSNNDTNLESDLDVAEENNDDETVDGTAQQIIEDYKNDNDLDDEEYCCYEYPLLAKRRRLF